MVIPNIVENFTLTNFAYLFNVSYFEIFIFTKMRRKDNVENVVNIKWHDYRYCEIATKTHRLRKSSYSSRFI